jgi:NAD(P)-dependent dehydrogenase (short-subunit alcohol dehydrogenase family)
MTENNLPITGSSGLIGSEVVSAFASEGWEGHEPWQNPSTS